jgi:hypothetical protein
VPDDLEPIAADHEAGPDLDAAELAQLPPEERALHQMRYPSEGAWAVLSPNVGLMVLPDTREASAADQARSIAMLPGWSRRQLREGKWVHVPLTVVEWLAGAGSHDEPDIDSAVMVLGYFDGPGPGIPPGDFFQLVIQAISRADEGNTHRLRQAYPRLVATVRMYLEIDGGREHLIAMVEAYRAELAESRTTTKGAGA